MKVEQQGDNYVFTPLNRDAGRLNSILTVQSLYYLLPGLFVIFSSFMLASVSLLAFLATAAAGVGSILVGIRYARRATDKEQITVTPETLLIQGAKNAQQFGLNDIDSIHYTGYAAITDHPLKTRGFDYLGFETRDKEIARLHDEGHIKLTCNGKTVIFGKELASWDAQKISDVLSKVTEGRLYIQDLPEEIPEDVYMRGA